MLTRLYIDNFKCFVNFEYRPARTQLILGANGSGKSSLIEALSFLRRVAVRGESVYDLSLLRQRTRWQSRADQTFELDVALRGREYNYRLVIGSELERTRVRLETVRLDGRPVIEFIDGEVHPYNDAFEPRDTFRLDPHCSALAAPIMGSETQALGLFRDWLRGLVCFRLNPFAMASTLDGPDANPASDLSNFAAWYGDCRGRYPDQYEAFLASLRAALDGFIDFGGWGQAPEARFRDASGETQFRFNELSEGQLCLIGLYAILHFVLARGHTVILDEPDNFVSLREIQPWLMAADDAVEDSGGQILIISHHPEIINQWAPPFGVRFVRDGLGPVRVVEFHGEPESALTPAELVARGWEHE